MRELTKWPRLLVFGKPVTREQTNDILVRTNHWYMSTNDSAFARAIYDAMGVKCSDERWVRPDSDDLKRFEQELGVIDVEYLANAQVMSSWIGGPHGWCDWNGNIGCSTYNIGKWPRVETVDAEWKTIAEAFPYLDLRAQLVPDEGEAEYPAVEWRVQNGRADLVESTELLRPITDAAIDMVSLMFMNSGRERGVPIPRLVEAVEQVRHSRKASA